MSESETVWMTVVFEFDVSAFEGNPYHVDTPFGRPVVICNGDVVSERDDLESQLEDKIVENGHLEGYIGSLREGDV